MLGISLTQTAPRSILLSGATGQLILDAASVLEVLNMQGADASTTITNDASLGGAWTAYNGAALSVAQAPTGFTSSLALDGVSAHIRRSGGGSLGALPGGEEMFIRFASLSSRACLSGNWETILNRREYIFDYNPSLDGGTLRFALSSDGSASEQATLSGLGLTINTWNYLSWSRSSTGKIYFGVNGVVAEASAYSRAENDMNFEGNASGVLATIGARTSSGGTTVSEPVNGFIAGYRLVVGQDWNTASFSVPDAPHPAT